MTAVGEREIRTQRRVVGFFQDALAYDYLGHWQDRPDNRNVEEELFGDWLRRQGHDDGIVTKTLHDLKQAAAVGGSKRLYDANREVYERLRYGVKVKPSVSEQTVTVWLIDWRNPGNNHFAIAEEVTVTGRNTKRPDLVLYVNGIALGVLELKRSTVSVSEGIRQNLDSQKPDFIEFFFATTQLVMAGNDTEGLRYSVIETPEKHWLRWKETDAHPAAGDNLLLRELGQLCGKERLLEIVHDFVVFDAGVKKICRHNQYFGVQAARENVEGREGGIIWHTQGSGKSLTMVWLAKWIREHVTDPRVLLITDRTELDEQIEQVFKGVGEDIHRTRNGANLVQVFGARKEWLICSLIHKFGVAEEGDVDAFVEDIKRHIPGNFAAKGEIFVFVDECHRTQSGKLHRAMRDLLPEATLIGFTGTPLLKDHKRRSIETFGPYIHTYKYDEAVADGVVLDLRYEARDIDQHITSPAKIDQWFEAKTKGLTDVAAAQLKQRWGTMRKVLSARDRLSKIVADILLDTYIRADDSESLSEFDDLTLVELIVERGKDGLESALSNRIRKNPEAMAETIENNVRRIVIDEMAVNPKYYERMSKLLDALILQRKQESIDYKEYLDRIIALAKRIKRPETGSSYPPSINTAALRALFDNLESGQDSMAREPPPPPYGGKPAQTDAREEKALALDRAIRRVKRADWRGNVFKEREVRNAIRSVLTGDEERVDAMFEIVKSQPDY